MTNYNTQMPRRAQGHSDLAFCNRPCLACERQMVRRAEIARGKRLRDLSITMREVPRGR